MARYFVGRLHHQLLTHAGGLSLYFANNAWKQSLDHSKTQSGKTTVTDRDQDELRVNRSDCLTHKQHAESESKQGPRVAHCLL